MVSTFGVSLFTSPDARCVVQQVEWPYIGWFSDEDMTLTVRLPRLPHHYRKSQPGSSLFSLVLSFCFHVVRYTPYIEYSCCDVIPMECCVGYVTLQAITVTVVECYYSRSKKNATSPLMPTYSETMANQSHQ